MYDFTGINPAIIDKWEKLQGILKEYGKVAVSFSGGVDSTFLLRAAKDALGDGAAAMTISSCFIPERELKEAWEFCEKEGIRQYICEVKVLNISGIRNNPPDRCYICKKNIFSSELNMAAALGYGVLAEGSNMDDMGDYRPGLKAIRELKVESPLQKAGLYKEEIRILSRRMGLKTWSKPSFACLASRFAYGEELSEERLLMVDRAEEFLMKLGFTQFRVRIHGSLARIEVLPEQFELVMKNRDEISERLKSFGFSYVTMDLTGYRTGSMNDVLKDKLQETGNQ